MKGQRLPNHHRGEAARTWRAGALAFALLLGGGVFGEIPAALERTAFEQGIATADVEFRNGPTTLRGTIFQPGGAGSGPGVVILGGSERGARNDYKKRVASKFAESGLSALIYDSPGTLGGARPVPAAKPKRCRPETASHRR